MERLRSFFVNRPGIDAGSLRTMILFASCRPRRALRLSAAGYAAIFSDGTLGEPAPNPPAFRPRCRPLLPHVVMEARTSSRTGLTLDAS